VVAYWPPTGTQPIETRRIRPRPVKKWVQEIKTTTDSGTTKTAIDTLYGKVEAYDLNKSIKLSVPGKLMTSKSFDLTSKDETMNVAPGLKVGDWVKGEEKTDNNNHQTLTVERWSEQASR
jgi:hypothetical protein